MKRRFAKRKLNTNVGSAADVWYGTDNSVSRQAIGANLRGAVKEGIETARNRISSRAGWRWIRSAAQCDGGPTSDRNDDMERGDEGDEP